MPSPFPREPGATGPPMWYRCSAVGVLNALILKPLNVPHAGNLYNSARKPFGWDQQSYPDYLDYRDRNSTFSGIAAYDMTTRRLRRWRLSNRNVRATGEYSGRPRTFSPGNAFELSAAFRH